MTFAAPIFLFATLAGLVPVIIHLIHRKKAKQVRFSTLRFLQLSVRKTRRRKYVDDVLLMIARIAVMILIALGLARPEISGLRALLGGDKGLAIALVVDNSASMDQADDGHPRFDSARSVAEAILALHREGDPTALVLTGGPPDPVQGHLHHGHESIRQALAQARPSFERADLAARIVQARKVLDLAGTPAKEIYVITDNQALAWEGQKPLPPVGQPPPAVPSQPGAAGPLAGDATVIVINVRGEPMLNAALQEVRLQSPAPTSGVPVRVSAEVMNAALVPQQKHLELFLDGARQGVSPTLALPPGGSVRYEFSITPKDGGIHKGEIHLAEDDASALDNRLYFALTVAQQIPVAVIKPRRHELPYGEDSFYLERALASDDSDAGAVRIVAMTPDEVASAGGGSRGAAPFDGCAVVYAVNLPAPAAELAGQLREYVRGGGHLVWICGSNVQPVAYNWMSSLTNHDLLPAPLEAPRTLSGPEGDGLKVGFLDKDYPAFAPLTEPASLYRSVLVHQCVPISWGPRSEGRLLARLDDGQPLLIERAVGAGSVLFLATGLTADWSNLPLKPLFLPLLARLTFHLAGVEADRPPVIAGSPATIPLGSGPARAGAVPVEVVRPSGEVVRLRPLPEDGPILRYAETHDVGIYLFRVGRDAAARSEMPLPVAVNIDPGESDPTTLTREEIQARFPAHKLVYCERPEAVTGTLQRLHEGTSLWESVLAIVLIVLVFEAFLANGGPQTLSPWETVPEGQVRASAQPGATASQENAVPTAPAADDVMEYLRNL
jgi:hypothetical protein